jgi:hypothetical protein
MISSPMITICIDDAQRQWSDLRATGFVRKGTGWVVMCCTGCDLPHTEWTLFSAEVVHWALLDDSGIDEVVQAFIEYDLEIQKQLV